MREWNEGQQVDADNRCAMLLTAKAAHELFACPSLLAVIVIVADEERSLASISRTPSLRPLVSVSSVIQQQSPARQI
jgi:hypothetical protein